MKKIIFIVLTISLISCKDISVTKNEVKGVQAALDFYGGNCLRRKGFTKGTSNNNSFILEMQDSDLLNQNEKLSEYHAGHIAYMFYTNLENEKSNYDKVKVVIKITNGKNYEYEFSDKLLKQMEKKMPEVNETLEIIKNSDYNKLKDIFDQSLLDKIDPNFNPFSEMDAKAGKVKKAQFQGFKIWEEEKFGEILSVYLVTFRGDEVLPLFFEMKMNNGKLVGLHS